MNLEWNFYDALFARLRIPVPVIILSQIKPNGRLEIQITFEDGAMEFIVCNEIHSVNLLADPQVNW